MTKDKMTPVGRFKITVKKADGSVRKQFREYKWAQKLRKMNFGLPRLMFLTGYMASSVEVGNLVTNAGFAGIAARIGADAVEAAFDYIAVGTGTTAAAAGDTTLETELATSGLTRAQGTDSRETTTQTNDTLVVTKTFTVTGSAAVTECGLLNASSSGTLLGRNVFSAINVANGDSLQIDYKVQVS